MAPGQHSVPKPKSRTARVRGLSVLLGLLIILAFVALIVVGGMAKPRPGLGGWSHDGVVDSAEGRHALS